LTAAAGIATSAIVRQDPKAETRPAEPASRPDVTPEQFEQLLAKEGIRLDRDRGLVAVRGRFCSPKQPLEYLITAPHGSHYESLVAIDAKPSILAAALMAIGFDDKGSKMPVRKPAVPRPSDAELAEGKKLLYDVEPAVGEKVHIYVEWNDVRGFQRHRLESLVFERIEGRTIRNLGFVFVNSAMLTPRNPKERQAYAADLDGNFLSCSSGGQPVLVYTQPHPYATEGDFEIYQPNWTLVPSEALPVVVLLSRNSLDTPLVKDMTPPESAPASRPADK
jgi:hypothetical protein